MKKKVSYTLDTTTLDKLNLMATNWNKKKSHIIEEAIDYYYSIFSDTEDNMNKEK